MSRTTTTTKTKGAGARRMRPGSAMLPGRGEAARAVVREGGWWHLADASGPVWRSLSYRPRPPTAAQLERGPLEAIAKAGGYFVERGDGEGRSFVATPAGRPRKGLLRAESSPRSVRLPDPVWARLEALAGRLDVSVNALVAEAVADRLQKKAPRRRARPAG